mmetsp:Transcript_49172/g.140756  ORF Transcript_49172/g.140756 Transcript_49172/m.140756 type:complete len:155 (-) Transcript_49172:643-1107(-)
MMTRRTKMLWSSMTGSPQMRKQKTRPKNPGQVRVRQTFSRSLAHTGPLSKHVQSRASMRRESGLKSSLRTMTSASARLQRPKLEVLKNQPPRGPQMPQPLFQRPLQDPQRLCRPIVQVQLQTALLHFRKQRHHRRLLHRQRSANDGHQNQLWER